MESRASGSFPASVALRPFGGVQVALIWVASVAARLRQLIGPPMSDELQNKFAERGGQCDCESSI